MKKKSLIILVVITLLFTACGDSGKGSDGEVLKIGILQFTQHPALDAAREGFEAAFEDRDDIELVYQNAQASIPNIQSISNKFIRDEVDLIFAIATPVAQGIKNINDEIPVVFTAITDPVEAKIVDSWETSNNNFTGTSDEAPIEEQLEIFKQIDDSIEKIGFIYSTNEANSQIQLDMVKEIAPSLGLEVEAMGVSDINELAKATDSLIARVDAIYTPADNMIASGINVIAQKAIQAQIPTVAAEGAHVKNGILITKGINYFDLGEQSAQMVDKILFDGVDPADLPIEKSDNIEIEINEETLEKLGLDPNLDIFN